MQEQSQKQEAARAFSRAADMMVDACRQLEQCGMADQPIEDLLQALEQVTHRVHQMHQPDERVQFETADLAGPMPCHVAASRAGEES